MKHNSNIALLTRRATVAAAALLSWAAFAGIEWNFPRLGNCHEGMEFADGVTGVLVWGGGDTLNLTVGREDLWDHRGGYEWTAEQSFTNILRAVERGDSAALSTIFAKEEVKGEPRNPFHVPLGRVVITLPGKTLQKGVLDPFTGTGEITLAEGGSIGLAMCKDRGGVFALRLPEGAECRVEAIPSTDWPKLLAGLEPIGYKPAVKFAGESSGGFTIAPPADPPATLKWRRSGGEVFVATTRTEGRDVAATTFDAVAASAKRHWAEFWRRGARIKVPDETIQRIFDYGMYRFGAMTDPDGVPAGLQGPWLEDDKRAPWSADYHFNINVQECYSPAYRGGHFENLLPLFRMVLSWRPLLRDNAKKFVGIDDGYAMSHAVDDRGVHIGGYWAGTVDFGSTAWVAAMMFRYVRYSRDVAFLKEGAYDFMKGAFNVYFAMMEDDGKSLAIPMGPSPEWGGKRPKDNVGRNPSFQLAAAHRLAVDLAEAAGMLGESPDPRWLDVSRRLPRYNMGPHGIRIFDGQELEYSHRHHSHLAGLYPFDVIDVDGVMEKKAIRLAYEHWMATGTGKWTGWCVPWAAIIHVRRGNAVAAVEALHAWDAYFCDDGHGSHHNAVHAGYTEWIHGNDVMQMDGQCAAVTAILELMAHEINGKVEFFRGCPSRWHEVSFENLALSDGRRVSGRRVGGKVEIREYSMTWQK